MLRSKDRLRFREVASVFEKGSRRTAPLFSLSFLAPADRTAFAVTVSKKIAKNAVDRNKIRRRVYSVVSKIKNTNKPAHIVYLPKKEIITTSFDVLEREIPQALIKAGLVEKKA